MKLLTRLNWHFQQSPDAPPQGGGEPVPAPAPDLSTPTGIEQALGDYVESSGMIDDSDFQRKPHVPDPVPDALPDSDPAAADGDQPPGDEPPVPDPANAGDGTPAVAGDGGGEASWQSVRATDDQGYPIEFEVRKTDKGPVYRFKAADEVVEATHPELIQGYQRQQDYSRKVNETLDKASQLDPYLQLVARLKSDPGLVDYVVAYLNGNPLAQPDANQLVTEEQIQAAMKEDPDQADALFTKRAAQLREMETFQRHQEMQQYLVQDYMQRQEQLAQQQIPNYSESKSQIDEFLKSVGFTEQEIVQGVDVRYRKVANMARLWNDHVTSERAPQKELEDKRQPANPPKVVRSGTGKQSKPGPTAHQKNTLAHAQKTGMTEDWGRYLGSIIPDDWVE